MVIQGTALVAVRAQLDSLAAMVTSPFPPAALKAAVLGLSEKEHWAEDSDEAATNRQRTSEARHNFGMDLRVTGLNAVVSGLQVCGKPGLSDRSCGGTDG